MLDRKTAQEISELCVGKIDWTVVGLKGGAVAIFTGGDRYHASYGAEGDPVKETSRARESGGGCRFESDGTASPDHPVICTVSVHDGIAETDVRHMPPMPGGDAYEYVANMELDRRFAHDWSGEYYWPDWPNGTAEAWRQFREEIEDVEPDDYVPFEVGPSVWKLMFALSEITGTHYLAETPLDIKTLPGDASGLSIPTAAGGRRSKKG